MHLRLLPEKGKYKYRGVKMEMLVTKFSKGKYRNEGELFAEPISNENVKLMGEMIALQALRTVKKFDMKVADRLYIINNGNYKGKLFCNMPQLLYALAYYFVLKLFAFRQFYTLRPAHFITPVQIKAFCWDGRFQINTPYPGRRRFLFQLVHNL